MEMTAPETVNQLVFANVAGSQAGELIDRLVRDGFYVTQIDSRGGILHESTVSLLIGLNRARLTRFLDHIRACCQQRRRFIPAQAEAAFLEAPAVLIEAVVGGATVYVFEVERFEQI